MSSPRADDTWCRSFHPAPDARVRLVCFPHAGGSASYYFPISAALHPGVDVIAVQYPGRQDRRAEPAITSISELADLATRALSGWSDRPLTLFGHSMGAVVAFEVARRLERLGREPDRLFLSGRRAPRHARRDGEMVHLRDDDGLITEIKRLSGTDLEVLGNDELLRMVLPAIRSDYRAIETHHIDDGVRVRCPITALVGDADSMNPPDEVRAWSGYTTGDFDMRVFPGGHFYLANQQREVLGVLTEHFRAAAAPRDTSRDT